MKKVLAFGCFDLLHEGHKYFLREAKKLGDELIVVVGRDSTVKCIKNHETEFNEDDRVSHVEDLGIADKVLLGNEGNKWKVIEDVRPDIIALGYDQDSYTEGLEKGLKEMGLDVKIVRLDSYRPEIYKSSFLKKDGKNYK